MKRPYNIDVILVILAVSFWEIFSINPQLNETVKNILDLLFVLLPGYSITAAVFPLKKIGKLKRLLLSFVFSIVIISLLNLGFNLKQTAPPGVFMLFLSIFTVSLVMISFIRRIRSDDTLHKRHADSKEKFKLFKINKTPLKEKSALKLLFFPKSQMNRLLSIILIISIIFAVSMTVYAITVPQQGEKFTEFYILGPNGKASDYPTNLHVGEDGKILIGVVNHEHAKIDYHLIIQLDGRTIKEENVTLSNEEKWENTFSFSALKKGKNQKLEFLLYKQPDNNNVYRSLHLWINVDNNPIELKRA